MEALIGSRASESDPCHHQDGPADPNPAAAASAPPTPAAGPGVEEHRNEKEIISTLAAGGLRLHGFGVKTAGLRLYGQHLVSADSMAWSRNARAEAVRRGPAPGCSRRSCANCPHYALAWRDRVVSRLARLQLNLPLAP